MSARPRWIGLLLPPLLALSSAAATAQDLICDPGDREVRGIAFSGNRAFEDERLESAIATTATSWWRRVHFPFSGERRCLDELELQRDVLRLRYFYRQRGYYQAQVDTTLAPAGEHAVRVNFAITEGPPVIITTLTVSGLDTLPGGDRLAARMREMEGGVYDRVELQAAVDSIIEQLHDRGYANAQHLLRQDSVDYSRNVALVHREFIPGRVHRIARIDVEITPVLASEPPEIDEGTVRSLLAFEEGDIYRERDLFRSQRELYLLDAYRHVEIRLRSDSLQPPGDSLLAILVRLTERDMRSVRAGVGWATLDCFRTQARLTDRDFLGGARRLEIDARLTKIARGEPLDFAPNLCTANAREDPFSSRINYYTGVTVREPRLFGTRNVPSLTIYSERRSEFEAYERTTPVGGLFSVTREQRPRLPITLAYQFEFGRTRAEEAVFCSVFNVCDLSDISRLTQRTRLAVLSGVISRDRTDNPLEPTRGDQVRLEFRHASSAIGSDPTLEFNRATATASFFLPVTSGTVLALRAQVGGVFSINSLGGATNFVPPQERLYAGGPTSVRGYNQNELGPVVYIVTPATVDTLFPTATDTLYRARPAEGFRRASPTGGNTLMVANAELRLRSPFLSRLLDWVAFMDVGHVYNRGPEPLSADDLRWTPGIGLRVASPVGPLRMDVAYNGYPRRAGAAYLVDPISDADDDVSTPPPRLLRCASPGNTLSSGVGGDCPPTFAPPSNGTFFSRLVFHFSIGQAF